MFVSFEKSALNLNETERINKYINQTMKSINSLITCSPGIRVGALAADNTSSGEKHVTPHLNSSLFSVIEPGCRVTDQDYAS